MSNDFQLVRKANRGFEAIADAVLDDVYEEDLYEEDLVVDDEGNVYALIGEIEKADEPKASAGRYATGMAFGPAHGLVAGRKGRKLRAAGNEWTGAALGSGLGAAGAYGVGRQLGKIGNPKARAAAAIAGAGLGAAGGLGGSALGIRRAQAMGHYKPQGSSVEKGLPSIARQLMREAGTTGKQMSHGEGFYASHEALGVAPHAGSGGYSRSHVLSRKISANQGGRRTGKDLKIVAGREGGLSEFERTHRIEAQKIQGKGNSQFARNLAAKQPGRLGGAGNVARQEAIATRAAAQRPGAAGRSALAGQTGGMDARGLQAAGGASSSTLADRALAANARAGLSRPAPAAKKRKFFGR